MCFAIQDGTECAKMPSLSVSHIPSCGKGRQGCWAMGKSTPGYLAGSQTVLSILQNTTELPGAARAGEQSKSTKLGEPECDRSKGPGPCAFEWVTRLGPRRGKGKRALLGRGAGWAHIWANRNKCPNFSQTGGKNRSMSGSDCGHWEKMTNEYS